MAPAYSAVINDKVYVNISPDSTNEDIKKFQQLLAELNIYQWVIDGKFETLKKSIAIFQVNAWLIPDIDSNAAWYIGPLTYKHLLKTYGATFEELYKKYIGEPWKITPLATWETYFVVTAYYSPLKWQYKYATGSYWWDIRLNWEWVRWASWVRVHAWFIAAPKNYAFGTKIELDWLGVWVVQDRWGAIVNAWVRGHWYDRLDVWMWYWDAGLNRALRWGKRTVKGRFRESTAKVTMNFSTNIPLTQSYTSYTAEVAGTTVVDPKATTPVITTQQSKEKSINNKRKWVLINPNSPTVDILWMQNLFIDAWIYAWKADGKYITFKKSLIAWQIQNKIINSRVSYWAWYLWNQTLTLLEKKHPEVFLKTDETEKNSDNTTQSWSTAVINSENSEEKTTQTRSIDESSTKEQNTDKKTIPDSEEIDPKQELVEKNGQKTKLPEELILQTYWITLKEKEYIESIYSSINKIFEKKYWKNALKFKSKTQALIRKIDLIISTSTNPKLTGQLLYLKTLFK